MNTVTELRTSVKAPRTIHVLEAPSGTAPGLLRIVDKGNADAYWFAPIDGADVDAWHLRKFRTDVTYAVVIAPASSCECAWATHQGHVKACRHISGLAALRKAGRLPGKQKHAACNHCCERV